MIGSGCLTLRVCVFVISAECLWMIGVSDTACFLLGRSSPSGQTGGTKVYENEPQLSSLDHHYSPTNTTCMNKHKHTYARIFLLYVSRIPWIINLHYIMNNMI